MSIPPLVWTSVLFLSFAACARTPEQEGDTVPPTITDRDWELVMVGSRDSVRGAQDRPVTIRLDSAESRAGGFAGCNQFSAAYVLSGDSLSFEPPISTRMFCPGVMDVETSLLAALERVTRYEATDSTLTLLAASEPVARFRARSP